MQRLILLFFFLYSYCTQTDAQVVGQFRSFPEDLGTIAASYQIMQDSYGFIWAATGSGLIKTDGYSYKKYIFQANDTTSLSTNDVFCSFENTNGDIWVGTVGKGLVVLDREKDVFQSVPPNKKANGLRVANISHFARDSSGNIWLGGSDGLQYVKKTDVENGIFKFNNVKISETNFSPKRIRSILIDQDGSIWIASQKGIAKISKDLQTIYKHSSHPTYPNQIAECIANDRNGNLFFALRNTPLLKYSKATNEFIADSNIQIGTNRVAITFDLENRLWLKDNSALLYCYDLTANTVQSWDPRKPNDMNLRGPYSRSLLTSSDGTLWNVGTGSNVFQHLPASNKQIESLLIKELGDQHSSAIFVDDQYIWIGQLLSGIKRISKVDGSVKEFTQENSPLLSNRVYNFLRCSDKELLICGRGGVYVYNYLTGKIRLALKSRNLMRYAWYDQKETIWIGAESTNPYELNIKTWKSKKVFTGKDGRPAITNVRQFISGEGDWLWISSMYNGLYKYNRSSKEYLHYSSEVTDPKLKINSNQIESFHLSDNNTIYLGTRSGLHIIDLNTDTHKTITKKEGLSDNLIASITDDGQGHLWVSTSNGLNKFNKQNQTIVSYGQEDGFSGNQYYPRADCLDEDGFMYVAGPGGVDRFKPEHIRKNSIPPIIQLTSIEVLGKTLKVIKAPETIKELNLTHKENFIKLGFSPIHYAAPNKNRIVYRLDSNSEDWTEAENYKIPLIGLAPGKYDLQVKAANGDGLWTKTSKNYRIVIAYPWWRSTAFYLLSFLLFGAVLFALFKVYTNRLKARQKEQEAHKIRVAELELKSLSAQMNPHFLFNSLNSIKSLISQKKNDAANEYITRYSQLVRRILNNSRSKFVRLQNELEALELYLELEALRLEHSFEYSIDVGPNVNADFIEVPPSLLQPFVENAIWHGLLLKESDDRKLHINVFRDEDYIVMEIVDNGIGIPAATRLKQNKGAGRASLGVTIAEERMELLRKLYGRETSIVVEDLGGGKSGGAGTRVVIRIFHEG